MNDCQYLYLSYNVSNLVYHIVCSAKYCLVVFDKIIDDKIRQIWLDIEKRYEYIKFFEIGTNGDHVHFWRQSTLNYCPIQIVKIIKSITARQIFLSNVKCPQVKKQLWGRHFWNDGYFVLIVGKNQNETVIKAYVRNQGKQDADYT